MKMMAKVDRSMKRRLFNILSALSLLLCVATVVLWCVDYGNTPPSSKIWSPFSVFGWSVGVGAGGFSVHHNRKLPQPIAVAGADGIIGPGLYDRACGRPWERLGVRYTPFAVWSQKPETRGTVVGVFDAWSVKYWWATAATAVLPILWLVVLGWRRLCGRRHIPGTCRNCGYDLRASKERCPECGTAILAESVVGCEAKTI